jgi:hypothetical protein
MREELEKRLEEALSEKNKLESNLTDLNLMNSKLNELHLVEKVNILDYL